MDAHALEIDGVYREVLARRGAHERHAPWPDHGLAGRSRGGDARRRRSGPRPPRGAPRAASRHGGSVRDLGPCVHRDRPRHAAVATPGRRADAAPQPSGPRIEPSTLRDAVSRRRGLAPRASSPRPCPGPGCGSRCASWQRPRRRCARSGPPPSTWRVWPACPSKTCRRSRRGARG
jgi:hypothetical protein